jgi:hypothetical protein
MNFRFHRSIKTLGILLAIVFGVTTYGAAKPPEPPSNPYYDQPAPPDLRGTQQQPLVIGKLPEDPAHAANERDLTTATKVLALFTFALWIANIWLIVETKRASAAQAKATQDAIEQARLSANAMRDVAEATKNNAVLMSGMLSKQMRAYIAVNIGRGTAQRGESKFGSSPEIVNVGLTPAKRVSYRVKAAILDAALPRDHVFPDPEEAFTNDATLNSRQTFTIGAAVSDRFLPADVAEISAGAKRRLYVWGIITYDDVFGGHWETRFCHNFIFFDTSDSETGKTLHQFNGFYFPGHNDAT